MVEFSGFSLEPSLSRRGGIEPVEPVWPVEPVGFVEFVGSIGSIGFVEFVGFDGFCLSHHGGIGIGGNDPQALVG